MKNESQSQSRWLVFASLVMAFLLALSSVASPQMIAVSYAKYTSVEEAGVVYLSIDHAHAVLTTGFKLNRALATGTTTSNAPTTHTEITADDDHANLTEVYFGTPTEYASQIAGITGVDVSYYGDKSIMLYKNDTKAYIVSDRTIATCEHFGSAFEKFKNLTKVHFSDDFDTTRATTFAYLFYQSSSLASIENLNTFDTSNATSMQSMFYASSPALKSLDVSSFNTSKVEDMGSIFRGNSNLSSLDVTGFDTSKVWDMGGMFAGCAALTSIDVTDFDTSKAEIMTVMFSGCTGLKTLDLRSFSCESLTNMNEMFSGCSNLTTIYADYDFDCRGLSDPAATDETDANGNYTIDSAFANVFKGCTSLVGGSGTKYNEKIVHNLRAVVDVNLAVEQTVFQSTIGYFTHYSGAEEGSTFLMNGQDFNAAIKTLANGSSKAYSFSDAKINKIYFGKTGDYNVSGLSSADVDAAKKGTIKAYWNASTGTIYVLSDYTICFSSSSDYMFDNLRSVTGIYFNNISTSAVRTMQRMFGYCPKLSDINLSKFETHNVVDYGSCFHTCESLSANTANNNIIPYIDTGKARDIGGLFLNCTGLSGAINMSNLSSAKAETIASLIQGCTGITSINISGFTVGSGLTNTSSMFSGCTSLTTIHTNAGFNLNLTQVTNGGNMFTGCTNLVGGNGTKFTTSHVDKSYARPDVAGTAGYFTSTASYSLRAMSLAMTAPAPVEDVSATDIPSVNASASDIIEDTDNTETSETTAVTVTTTNTAVSTTASESTTTTASDTAVTSATDAATTTASTDATTVSSTSASTTSVTGESSTDSEATTTTTAASSATSESEQTTAATAATTTTAATAASTTTTAASAASTTSTTVTTTKTTTTSTAATTKATTTTTTTTTAAVPEA